MRHARAPTLHSHHSQPAQQQGKRHRQWYAGGGRHRERGVARNGLPQAGQEPLKPRGDIHVTSLCGLQAIHFDDAIGSTVSRSQGADVDTQAPGKRRTHRMRVEGS
jgi:hypothetical protein